VELSRIAPEDALKHASRLLAEQKVYDCQFTMEVLAGMPQKQAADIILNLLNGISKQPLGIRLDILEAAKKRKEEQIKEAIATYEESLDKNDPLASFKVTLAGGDPNRGKRVFYRHGAAQCVRCHMAEKGREGGVAGPHLGESKKPYEMEYLLESLILPNARVSPGFGMVSLTRKDGTIAAGMLLEDGKDIIAIAEPASQERVEYKRSEIKSMTKAMSTMPPMGGILTKSEIRDLMAYLKNLSEEK